MAKPPFREEDLQPKRTDDINLSIPWLGGFNYEGSGRTLIALLIGAALLAISCASLVYMWWHDGKADSQHSQIVRALEVQTCVLTLNEAERREFRSDGKYCPTPRIKFRDEAVLERRRRVDHL